MGPDYRKPETKVPDNWNGQEVVTKDTPSKTTPDPAALVEWWQAFNDPSLSALVEMAIRANLDLRLAEARIRQARAALGVAGGAFWPEVDATALYERSHSSIVSIGPSGGGSSGGGAGGSSGGGSSEGVSIAPFRELFQVGLDASWEIDIFGGTRRNIEAAGADLRAAVEDRRDVLITLVGDVGSNYVNLRGFQQQIEIARKNLEAQKHNADIIQKRHDAGFVGGLDVANARAQVATTEATIPIFESSARAAIYSLGVLLGREPAALEKDLIKAGPIPPYPPEVPVGLPSDLLRRRPDIRRAEAQLHAATARIGVATAALFPQFSLTGTLGISSSDLTKLSNLANSKFWSFGPSVTWPIFAGGSLWWSVKVQDALILRRKSTMPISSRSGMTPALWRVGCGQRQGPGSHHRSHDTNLRVLGPGGHLQPRGAVGPGTGRPGEGPDQARSHTTHPAGGPRGAALGPAPPPAGHPPVRSPTPCRHGPHRGSHRRPVPQVFPHRELWLFVQ